MAGLSGQASYTIYICQFYFDKVGSREAKLGSALEVLSAFCEAYDCMVKRPVLLGQKNGRGWLGSPIQLIVLMMIARLKPNNSLPNYQHLVHGAWWVAVNTC